MNIKEKSSEILLKYNKDKRFRQSIKDATSFLKIDAPARQRIYHYIQGNKKILCVECSNEVKWNISGQRYREFCSSKCAHNSQTVKDKTEATCMVRYGTKTNLQSKVTKDKIKETNLMRYGETNYAKTKEFKEKYRITSQLKYGYDNPSMSQVIKDNITATHIKKYNRKRKAQCHISSEILDLKNDKDFMLFLYKTEQLPIYYIAHIMGINHSLLCIHFKNNLGIDISRHMVSLQEKQLREFVKGTGVTIEYNNRTVLDGREIDIYLPDLKIGIEFDGIYWHNDLIKSRYYHKEKDELALTKGVKIIHVTDYEWENKRELVKNRLLSKLQLSSTIYARKCKIVELKTSKDFLSKYHIQGYAPSKINLGLSYKGELVGVMTFGKSRFNNRYEYELIRYASTNVNIVGGASRLLAYFKRKHNPKNIISYCDVRWNTGELYNKLGFDYIRWNNPNYWYSKNGKTFESRQQYQKHKLQNKLVNYDASQTEYQNMINNGYIRYWDSGNTVWIWERD